MKVVVKFAEGGNKKEAKRSFSEGLNTVVVLVQDKNKVREKRAIQTTPVLPYYKVSLGVLFYLSSFELGILAETLGSTFANSIPVLPALLHNGSYTTGSG